jgi:hypothetical protein
MSCKNKIILIGIVAICILLSVQFVLGVDSNPAGGVTGVLKSTKLGEAGWWVKRFIYAYFSEEYSKEGIDYLVKNFENLIIMNPDAGNPEIKSLATPLLLVLMPMYILAIAATGFYLLFIGGSPSGRAKAKKMIVQLIIGMLLVSQSMAIIKIFIDTSSIVTRAIVNRASVDISIIPQNIASIFGVQHVPTMSSLGILHYFLTYVEIELGYFTMLPFLLMVWGALVIFFLRYAIIVLWIVLFPLAIALYSFETTRDLGRNLLEQTIVWVLMQEFIAVIALSTALVLLQKPANYFSPTLVVPLINTPVFSGVFDFVPFIGCFTILVAPLLMLRIFRSFLP